jgi:hypothetical protein
VTAFNIKATCSTFLTAMMMAVIVFKTSETKKILLSLLLSAVRGLFVRYMEAISPLAEVEFLQKLLRK